MSFETMAQMNTPKGMIAMVGLLAGLALAGVPALAQTPAPAAPATQGSGMMNGMPSGQGGTIPDMMIPDMNGMPSGQGGTIPDMMMDVEMMQKTSKMMDNCTLILGTIVQKKDGATAPAAPVSKC